MSRSHYLIIFLIALLSQSDVHAQAYRLIWSDEFDGSSLDLSKWTRETGAGGWGNSELQYYTDREVNSFVSGGFLTIKAMMESYGGSSYTSARLITKNKKVFKYGKVEARIKLPYGQGIWPAFWMLGQNISTVGWPACGEIDIMEMIGGGEGRDNKVYGTAHWDNSGHQSYGLSYTLPSGNFTDDFHLFSITWDSEKIEWYVDNNKYCTFNTTPTYLTEFQQNHFILLNVAVGGTWPGYPNATTVFPQVMIVDYVRAYQDTMGAPSINMSLPADSSSFNPGDNITLKASVVSQEGIKKVEFFQENVKIGETGLTPYSIIWRNVQQGCYNVRAEATTITGKIGGSDTLFIKVGSNCGQAPYAGYRIKVPGKIELENFDKGGSSTAYYDGTAGNTGGVYRTDESVDLEICLDAGGGYNIGYVTAGEWLKYSIYVTESTNYTFNLRAAKGSSSWGEIQFFIDDINVTGSMLVSSTGGWQTYVTVIKANVPLTQGPHTLKMHFVSGDVNVNYVSIAPAANPVFIKILSPNGGESFQAGSIQEVLWESSGVADVSLGLSTNNGTSWSLINSIFPAVYGSCRFLVPVTTSDQCKVMIIDKANSSITATSQSVFSIIPSTGTGSEADNNFRFTLHQNYPNPFNPATEIKYELGDAGVTKLAVYDVMGREVAILVNQYQSAGAHTAAFAAADLPSGIYFYSLMTGNYKQTEKMLLLK